MKELIDKTTVVTEIEKLSAYLDSLHEQRIIEKILSIIDALEVKESLTWKDIRELYIIFTEVDVEIESGKCDIQTETIGYYQEVLKRLKAQKGEQIMKEADLRQETQQHINDWQDVRERAAIAAMQGTITIIGGSDRYAFRDVVVEGYRGNEKTYPKEIAQFAVACADALIEELKKK